MKVKEFQTIIYNHLQNKFPQLEIIEEWRAFRGLRYQYSPIVDVAVGPFSTEPNENQTHNYNTILREKNVMSLLFEIYECHRHNVSQVWENDIVIPEFDFLIQKNQNARCLLSFEIENTSSKKHIMGSLINAASLGRIGIGIAFSESVKRTFLRIMSYLTFLKRVEKNTYDATNFLVITKDQLLDVFNKGER